MSSDENDKNVSDREAYYETVASQEELFLEQSEEEVRAILISDESRSQEDANHRLDASETICEQLREAAEELITGDSDDPPLSEETVSEMLQEKANSRRIA